MPHLTFPTVMCGLILLAFVMVVLRFRKLNRKPVLPDEPVTPPSKPAVVVKDVSALEIRDMLTHSAEPLAVLFYSLRCPACTTMEPLFQDAANRSTGTTRFVRCNVDANRSTSRRLGIKRIPTLMVFKGTDETALANHVGVMDPEGTLAFISETLAPKN